MGRRPAPVRANRCYLPGMRPARPLIAIAATVALALSVLPAFAHGGQMQGPRGSPSPGSPPPSGGVPPGTADAPGPVTGWETWWAANKDAWLRLGERMRTNTSAVTPSPGAEDSTASRAARDTVAREELVPVFLDAILDDSFEVRTAAAIALGKTRDPRAAVPLERAVTGDPHKDVRESALLGLGLLAAQKEIPFLDEIVRDRDAPLRMRCFAAFGLGMTGGADAVACLARHVDERSAAAARRLPPELEAAIYVGLGLTGSSDAVPIVRRALDSNAIDDNCRAFVVASLGRLRDTSHLGAVTPLLRHREAGIRRAAAIATGALARPADAGAIAALLDAARSESDPLTRHYAAVALGRIGGDAAVKQLRASFANADGAERVFIGIALGIARDAESFKVLRRALEQEKTESARGALSIALAIGGDTEARPLLEREVTARGSVWSAGYAALALGMLGSRESGPLLRRQLDATNDPRLRANLAIALGLVHDPRGEEWLCATLRGDGTLYERGGAAMALGQLRRTRNVPVLIDVYRQKRDHELVRAFAVVALGVIADGDDVPRLAGFRVDGDYSVSHDALVEAMSIY